MSSGEQRRGPELGSDRLAVWMVFSRNVHDWADRDRHSNRYGD